MHSEAQSCHQVSSTVAPHFIYWVTWAPPLGCQTLEQRPQEIRVSTETFMLREEMEAW